ncbi:MAG: hypothetical protein WD342_20265 [Verrucomicrobiales bacterium]
MQIKAAILLLAAPALFAGTPEAITPPPSSAGDWIKPLADIRTRYEFADIDGKDVSHALTIRERIGLETMAWNGFSALVEGEFSQAVVDDFHGGAPGADPFDAANSVIADPETNELNQAYLQYEGFETIVRAGRQRVIYDNAAFIGNVGWRQNEQTFDAVSVSNQAVDRLTFDYAYLNQVNRIFGAEADGSLAATPNVQDVAANTHLLNASYTGIEGLTLGGYAYLMDFQDKPNWDNNTFGLSGKGDLAGLALYGEIAFQDKAGFDADDQALYVHAAATKNIGSQAFTLGAEHLDAGFKTPLATVHAFNGYADAFIGGRLEGSQNGLADIYLAHATPLLYDIQWTNVLHAYGDNEISTGYGWEFDSVLVKKFDDHFTAIAKFAHFESEGDAYVGRAPLPVTTRVSIELNYAF